MSGKSLILHGVYFYPVAKNLKINSLFLIGSRPTAAHKRTDSMPSSPSPEPNILRELTLNCF